MKPYSVRPYARPSVCPSMGSQQQTQTRDPAATAAVDRLLQQQRAAGECE